jgi:hypothetical protein
VCTRFNIDVVDCLCGCRKREEGGIILMNFDDNALAKAVNNIKKSFPDVSLIPTGLPVGLHDNPE